MLTDTTIRRLNALCELSMQGKRINGLFRLMENPVLWQEAYANIHANKGAATRGIDGSSLDGFSKDRVLNLIQLLKDHRYRFKPVRRTYIPKANGKRRPLGIPSGNDKLVQEVVRMLLERIYEPIFRDSSHGFRPRRSCHTALRCIRRLWTGTKWIINMDIHAFFDNINHDVLMALLRQKIDDRRFLRLIEAMLKAGYVEDWKFHGTYSGTPQGGIVSPILANIYLHELDCFLETLKARYNRGTKRAENREYKSLSNSIKYRMKKFDHLRAQGASAQDLQEIRDEIKRLDTERKKMRSTDPFDEGYRRLSYCRYADDFLIGIIGPKADAEAIMDEIKDLLQDQLHLSVAEEKSTIVHASEGVHFLGYEAKSFSGKRVVRVMRSKRHTTVRSIVDRMQLHIPQKKLREFCKRKGYGDYFTFSSIHRSILLNLSDAEIVKTYNAEFRGLALYYGLATNAKRDLNKLEGLWAGSLLKTLAAKHKTTVRKTARRLKQQGRLELTVGQGKDFRTIKIESLKRLNFQPILNARVDVHPNTQQFRLSTTELIQRLNANRCEYCGKENGYFEVHHIRKLKDLKPGKRLWEVMMIQRRRKTMVLCVECHRDLHAGKLPSWKAIQQD